MTKEAINAQASALHRATAAMDRDQWMLTGSETSDFAEEAVRAFVGRSVGRNSAKDLLKARPCGGHIHKESSLNGQGSVPSRALKELRAFLFPY